MNVRTVLGAVDRLNSAVGRAAVLLMLPMMGVLAYEVVARFVFNRPTVWGIEMTSIVFGVMVALLGGYALLHGQHVRVDILFARLSDRGKAIVDTATSAVAFIFVGTLLWYTTAAAISSVASREVAETVFAPPLYPLRIVMASGVLLLFLQMVAKLIRDFQTIVQTNNNNQGARND
ncbi:TRAP transporter small permease subunit [Chloroflexota bacterium]